VSVRVVWIQEAMSMPDALLDDGYGWVASLLASRLPMILAS